MMRKILILSALATGLLVGAPVRAAESVPIPKAGFSFEGPFGGWDYAALQRGFQVYKEVCSACHAMHLMAYRNLGGGAGLKAGGEGARPEGIGFSEDEVKAIAAQYQVTDGPNDQGEMFQRPARPSDHFAAPFANEQAARAANGGAYPPDLSVIAKAREGGPDYIHALLTGYADPPPDFKLSEGKYYNKYFPGHQISMPPIVSDNAVTYADGTQATADQIARDVASYLAWASEPKQVERKSVGVQVMLFLLVLTGLLYAVKRRIWADIH